MHLFKRFDILFVYHVTIRGNLGDRAMERRSLYLPILARKRSERIMGRDLMYSLVKKRNVWDPDLIR